ncbi:hypothetical protein BS78_08G164600 [Paspalum vaginatum]|nr:hypothetical protein BS78_08G164600 [Paspalum vaginatum]
MKDFALSPFGSALRVDGFTDLVREVWNKPVRGDKLKILHIKLSGLAKALKRWSKSLICTLKLLGI